MSNTQKILVVNGNIVNYRYHNGEYEIRYSRDGYKIDVASKSLAVVKQKFIDKLAAGPVNESPKSSSLPSFKDYSATWLKSKKPLIKESTYNTYELILRINIQPVLGEMPIDKITRADIQGFLYNLVENGCEDKAERCRKLLKQIFDLAAEDYDLKNPTTRISLPHHEAKKGTALVLSEEAKLVRFCTKQSKAKGCSALLILVYTGMRVGELPSMTWDDKFIYCVSEKTRLGYAEVIRKIPISPMLRKVLAYIDMDSVRKISVWAIRDALARVFPERHLHELRYTFITRAKECGINPEVVMLMVGHTTDKDCKTSKVDRGYTDFSEEYILKEMEKYSYDLNV